MNGYTLMVAGSLIPVWLIVLVGFVSNVLYLFILKRPVWRRCLSCSSCFR